MNYSVCEQSKIVMSWPQVGAHTSLGCWHNFSLIPPLTAAAAWLFMKKSEKISRIFECAEVFHFALEQHPALMLLLVVWHLYNHAKKVEVSCCQSSCSPAQASPPPSLAICQLFKTFPTWRWHSPFQQSVFFFSLYRIGNYSGTNYRKIWVWVSAHCQSHQGSLFCFCSTTIFMARFCLGGADVMTCPLLLLNPLKVHFLSIFWSLVVLLYSFCNNLLWKD